MLTSPFCIRIPDGRGGSNGKRKCTIAQTGKHEEGNRMTDRQRLKQGIDQAWPNAISFNIGTGSAGMAEVLWRCDAMRGGRVYTSGLFGTEGEAQQFARKLKEVEPDGTFSVERIMASQVWN